MSGKKLLARTNRFLEPSPPHTVISSHFWGGKDDLQTEQRVAGEFLCQQFSLREQIPPATRVCFGSSISPPEKARIFSYNVCTCTATFLCYLLGLLGQATDTKPQEIQVQQRSGICINLVLAKIEVVRFWINLQQTLTWGLPPTKSFGVKTFSGFSDLFSYL